MSELLTNQIAPSTPSTRDLLMQNRISNTAKTEIMNKRLSISTVMKHPELGLVAMPGYCARPSRESLRTILLEGQLIAQQEYNSPGLVSVHRGPTWKPRTNPDDWHGEETTDPAGAHYSVTAEAEAYGNVAIEIGYKEQLTRYASRLALAWIGGRNINNTDLIREAATHDTNLPLGIKNGLDGDIRTALSRVQTAQASRPHGSAPVFLIYRGGTNAMNPTAWKNEYKRAWEATEGRFMVDLAHGSEMAHDPRQNFQKSIDGQICASDSLIELAGQGYAPAAVTMEASNLKSVMDPHMPLSLALGTIQQLLTIKAHRTVAIAA